MAPRSLALVVLALALPAASALGQGTAADYERANSLRERTRGTVFRDRVDPHWYAGGTRFWYRNDLPGDRCEFVAVEVEKGEKRPLFDHARLAAALSAATGAEVRAEGLRLERLEVSDAGDSMRFRFRSKGWRCDLPAGEVREEPAAAIAVPGGPPPRATERTGPETWITFANRTGGEVELFWLDFEGQRQSYGKLAPGGERRQHTFAGHAWLVVDPTGATLLGFEAEEEPGTIEIDGKAAPRRPSDEPRRRGRRGRQSGPSPSAGALSAFVKDFNVWTRTRDGAEQALTSDGTASCFYEDRFHFSPDAARLVALKTVPGDDRKVTVVESSPRDQLQPKLLTYSYPKPGDRIAVTKPVLFDLAERRPIPVADGLFANPWSIDDIRWAPDSSHFTFVYNQRGHQVLRVLAVDARTGEVRAVVDEQSPTFVDYAHKQFLHWLDETNELIWMSERDGWNHLYLYDARAGTVKNQMTRGSWVVRRVDHVDAARRQVWFTAGGIRPGQDPYHVHYCRVNFDGTGLAILTEGDGTHTVRFSPDRRALLDTWSRVDSPPVTELRRAEDGSLLCELERADIAALQATGWRAPERFVAKGRDGQTDIYGIIHVPTNFDPAKRYPVIEQIYAGPQDFFVPKGFRPYHGVQSIVELGFIVVQIDGMGTSWRSKAFHDVCCKNLADAGFPDRVLWLKAAAATRPYMDLSRVGIYGGSAGGQSAVRALIAHNDLYKVAAADCGCHDNRMDKIWWNELWMGWPVGPHYEEQSNARNASKLEGKLLLTFGELDQNVDPSSTMQLVDALVRADKDFDLLIVPGAGHGAGEGKYAARRRQDFFVRHLLGVEPRRP